MTNKFFQPATNLLQPIFLIYGPPGAGKSTVGQILAAELEIPFLDLDQEIENRSGKRILKIFKEEGEPGFRKRERAALEEVLAGPSCVVALGGGALLNPDNRKLAESRGQVICLTAPFDVLLHRLTVSEVRRPLLSADKATGLGELLSGRTDHYNSFPLRFDTGTLTPAEAAWEIQVHLGSFHVTGMGKDYDIRVLHGGRKIAGEVIHSLGYSGPLALVSDENVDKLYGEEVKESLAAGGYQVQKVVIPPGEEQKTVETVRYLCEAFLAAGVERSSTAVTLGGGMVSDVAGFAAAIYLRGIPWAAMPTTLLAMVDASLGGKTGIDLPLGKNLVGAFHPPGLVLVDPGFLASLPETELRSGMAEVVKHGIIGDPGLFQLCAGGWEALRSDWNSVIGRAIGVKVKVIQDDPYEQGPRAILNFGHTIGHALESASGYRLRHGEAVAIGMVGEARLAEQLGLAEFGLAQQLADALAGLGLPCEAPAGLERDKVRAAMRLDKKRRGGTVRFALPVRIGEVRAGIEVPVLEAVF